MNFLPEQLARYTEAHTSAASPLLQELERETRVKRLHPGMISGAYQGEFLKMFSYMIRPSAILEIGTYTGYSAICMAQGLQDDGTLHSIEINEELEKPIRDYIEKAELTDRIQLHIGNALDIIPTIDAEFDLVFIDADKINYSRYYDLVFDKVKKGGFILTDNVLWFGKVLENQKDKDTAAIHALNEKIQNDSRVDNVLLALRDGLMLARKK